MRTTGVRDARPARARRGLTVYPLSVPCHCGIEVCHTIS